MTGRDVWVGIDPGYDTTGIIVRHGDRLLSHGTIHWVEDESVTPGDRACKVGPAYGTAIADGVQQVIGDTWLGDEARAVLVAVEDLNTPTGYAGGKRAFVTPHHLIGAAKALAYAELAVARLPEHVAELVRVPAGGHGRNLLRFYPDALVTAGERAHGLNRPARHSAHLNHCRSAWDIAGAGPAARRTARALRLARSPRPGGAA